MCRRNRVWRPSCFVAIRLRITAKGLQCNLPKGVHCWAVISVRNCTRNILTIVDEPVSRKLQVAADPVWSQHKVNRTTELVGDQVTNGTRPVAGLPGGDHRGATDLLPFEHEG